MSEEAARRYGYARPKQFCDFDGRGTLLELTLQRTWMVTAEERTVVVTTQPWSDREAAECLAPYPRLHHVAQPCGRETGPGILLPLVYVAQQDPDAIVAILPSDHHVADDVSFADAIERAVRAVRADRAGVVLLGAVPDQVEDGLGWIVPASEDPCAAVATFREKPPKAEAEALLRGGAVVNTFVMVARVRTLAELCARHMPQWWDALSVGTPGAITQAYAELPPVNFSKVVLERAMSELHVMSLGDVGWSDIGTPDRLHRMTTPPMQTRAAAPRVPTGRSQRIGAMAAK